MRASEQPITRLPELHALTVLAFITRLWSLYTPAAVVWDETHYIRFAGAYFTGRYYVDVHPPLAKLLIAGAGALFGAPSDAFIKGEPAPAARILPAVAGALLIPVVYLVLRELQAGRLAATLGAASVLLDNALLTISRLILPDTMLLLFALGALLVYLVARRSQDGRRLALVTIVAFCAGAAVSIKWTGLSALALIGVLWLLDIRRRRPAGVFIEGAVMLLVPAIVYLGAFAVHFTLLPRTGTGDSSMSLPFRATLEGNVVYDPAASMSIVSKVAEITRVAQVINAGWATDRHAGASPWYTWPLATHSMGLWSDAPRSGEVRWIVLFANPVIWLGALAVIAVGLFQLLRRDRRVLALRWPLGLLAAGYAINFLPFALIARPMYLYHYFLALIFSAMAASLIWEAVTGARIRMVLGAVALAALAFVYLAPMSYGWTLNDEAAGRRLRVIERRP